MKDRLLDKSGKLINEGEYVSLGNTMTNHKGSGFFFDGDDDIYEVFFDESIDDWSLIMNVKPKTFENVMFMNHALHLLHNKMCLIVKKPKLK